MAAPRHTQLLLAAGIVCLEFATATTAFVTSTLLPVLVPELHAEAHIRWVLAAPPLGLFLAMPVAAAFSARAGNIATTGGGALLTLVAAVLSATATQAPQFSLGRFVAGFAGALLAVNGLTAAITHIDEALRRRVLTLSALMWVISGSVGPSLVLAAHHLWGWRVTVALPAVIVICAQAVIAVARPATSSDPSRLAPPVALRTFALPLGMALVLAEPSSILGFVGAVVSLAGFAALMPPGTLRARRGAPAALLSLAAFTVSYFGVDSVYTLFVTRVLSGSLTFAGVSLGAAAVAWALGQMAVEKVGPVVYLRHHPGAALAVVSALIAAMAAAAATTASPLVAAGVWVVAGFAVGIYYPTVYLRATTDDAVPAETLATAVISAESYGALIGATIAGTLTAAIAPPQAAFATLHVVMSATAIVAAVLAARSSSTAGPPPAQS